MVLLFLFGRERMKFGFLMRGLTVGVEFIHALIACIAQEFDGGSQGQTAILEQGKIVSFACTGLDTENLLTPLVNHDLSFLGMAFLLAGVEPTLFFWGRSTRCSLASTTITVRSKEPLCKAFLPGR